MSQRERPPTDRQGETHTFVLDGVKFVVTVNLYPDGRPCEIVCHKAGKWRGWADLVCMMASRDLQHGDHPGDIAAVLLHQRFTPEGSIGNPKSFADAIGRILEEYDTRGKHENPHGQA